MRKWTFMFVSMAVAVTVWSQPYRPVVVVGESMSPTYRPYEVIVGRTRIESVKRGDVVVFDRDGEQVVKRIAALEGDRVTRYWQQNEWMLPLQPAMERFFRRRGLLSRTFTVPHGSVYVLGDNPFVSVDSRSFGPISVDSLRAKIMSWRPSEFRRAGIERGPVASLNLS